MSVVAEALHEFLNVFMDKGVEADLVAPIFEITLIGQVTVEQQVSRTAKGRTRPGFVSARCRDQPDRDLQRRALGGGGNGT